MKANLARRLQHLLEKILCSPNVCKVVRTLFENSVCHSQANDRQSTRRPVWNKQNVTTQLEASCGFTIKFSHSKSNENKMVIILKLKCLVCFDGMQEMTITINTNSKNK